MNTESKKEAVKGILVYLAVTFVLTYGVEIFVIMPMAGSININLAYAAQMMIAGVMFIPATGALITRFIMKEKLTKENMMLSINLKGNLKYYGIAWFGVALMIILEQYYTFWFFPIILTRTWAICVQSLRPADRVRIFCRQDSLCMCR